MKRTLESLIPKIMVLSSRFDFLQSQVHSIDNCLKILNRHFNNNLNDSSYGLETGFTSMCLAPPAAGTCAR